jgi:hypothetical protein
VKTEEQKEHPVNLEAAKLMEFKVVDPGFIPWLLLTLHGCCRPVRSRRKRRTKSPSAPTSSSKKRKSVNGRRAGSGRKDASSSGSRELLSTRRLKCRWLEHSIQRLHQ